MMKKTVLFIALLGVASPCFAKACFAFKKEMIRNAECIVIVEITKIEESEKKGKGWTYSQKASATVKRCLKGDVEGDITIYGMENFICAQCKYEEGSFILFLRKDEGFWVGSNWNLGIRPITDDTAQWFKDDRTVSEMKPTPLDEVVAEIEKVLKEKEEKTPDNANES